MKVETDIVTSITVSLMGQVDILVIMYVETFKTDIIVLICSIVCSLILTIALSEIKEQMFTLLMSI